MNRSGCVKKFIIVLIALMLVACSRPLNFPGYLYGFGYDVMTITDLQKGRMIKMIRLPPTVAVRYALKINDHTILLSDGFKHSWQYNRFTGELRSFTQVLVMPTFMRGYDSILFYCGQQLDDLCRMSVSNPSDVQIVDSDGKADGGFSDKGNAPILAVSESKVIYSPNDHKVKFYDLETGGVGYLPFDNCLATFWRSKTDQLLCAEWEGTRYVNRWIHLDGTGIEHTSIRFGSPSYYFSQPDAAIIAATCAIDSTGLLLFKFATDESTKFGCGSVGMPGSTVWFTELPKPIPGISVDR